MGKQEIINIIRNSKPEIMTRYGVPQWVAAILTGGDESSLPSR